MELEIEDELLMRFKNLIIEVKFKDFRRYEIIVKIENNNIIYESKILYRYDSHLTFSSNIDSIENVIINKIIIPFYKGD